jgi:hypothetical protein
MRLYNQAHRFYAGIDLHARSTFTHVLDAKRRTVFEHDLPDRPDDAANGSRHEHTVVSIPRFSRHRDAIIRRSGARRLASPLRRHTEVQPFGPEYTVPQESTCGV